MYCKHVDRRKNRVSRFCAFFTARSPTRTHPTVTGATTEKTYYYYTTYYHWPHLHSYTRPSRYCIRRFFFFFYVFRIFIAAPHDTVAGRRSGVQHDSVPKRTNCPSNDKRRRPAGSAPSAVTAIRAEFVGELLSFSTRRERTTLRRLFKNR